MWGEWGATAAAWGWGCEEGAAAHTPGCPLPAVHLPDVVKEIEAYLDKMEQMSRSIRYDLGDVEDEEDS